MIPEALCSQPNDSFYAFLHKSLNQELVVFALRCFTNVNKEDAEDIVSSLFLKLLKLKPSFETYGHVQAYLYRAIRNECVNFTRKKRVYVEYNDFQDIWFENCSAKIEEQNYSELTQFVNEALEKLPNKERTVLKMFFIEGLNTKEIAERMGNPVIDTVRSTKSRALRSLRNSIHNKVDITFSK